MTMEATMEDYTIFLHYQYFREAMTAIVTRVDESHGEAARTAVKLLDATNGSSRIGLLLALVSIGFAIVLWGSIETRLVRGRFALYGIRMLCISIAVGGSVASWQGHKWYEHYVDIQFSALLEKDENRSLRDLMRNEILTHSYSNEDKKSYHAPTEYVLLSEQERHVLGIPER